ncbi:MAG: hypothetical protein EOP45_06120 [Sphingobacteriaceae bacterium]|nr:MAG: hypothetical protein EOP45_06120 [Sphingobacteriaceae bacterium]
MIGFPVTISDLRYRPDNDVEYHATIHYTMERDQMVEMHEIAKQLTLVAPHQTTQIQTDMFEDRQGNTVYVVKLISDSMLEYHKAFEHLSNSPFKYSAHISVDYPTWQKIRNSKATTVKQANINFSCATLMEGSNLLHRYRNGSTFSNSPKS